MNAAKTLYLPLTRDANHKYWVGKDNKLGVNEIMRGIGIIDPQRYWPEHSYRGLFVHQATHYIDENDYNMNDCPPEFKGYLEAWLKCKRDTGMEVLDIEQMRWDPRYDIAGTRDRKVKWARRIWIADIKTVGTPGAPGPKWAAETTAAYDMMEPPEPDGNARGRVSFCLYPDGNWKPELWEDFSDRTHFINYIATYRRLKFHGRIKNDTND